MRKGTRFRLTAFTKRLIAIAIASSVATLIALVGNYGGRQEYAKYRLKSIIAQDLSERGPLDVRDLATLMGIAHKESRFWNGAVGRNHEAGVMQLSESLARENGMRVETAARKSTPVQKLLFLNPSQAEVARDQRLDEQASVRMAVDHFLALKHRLRVRYGLTEEQALDLAVLAFHFGEANTQRWLDCSRVQTLDSVLNVLADPSLPQESWFKRAVAISFSEHVLRYRAAFLEDAPASIERTAPSLGDLVKNMLATPKEFYTRLAMDMQELNRATKERRSLASPHHCSSRE